MYNEDTFNKKDNRFIAEKVLQRIEQNNTNNKTGVKLFGEGYSRMTNTIYLEKDFLSQYYTIGIIGILLFILPYILIPFVSLFYILFNRKYFTFENISIFIWEENFDERLIREGSRSTKRYGNICDSPTFNRRTYNSKAT